MASYPCDILYGIVYTVSYPLLCTLQDDRERLSFAYRKIIRTIGFVVYPVMTIVCVLAQPIILTLFGEKWMDSAIYMALLCYPYMIVPICGANFGLLQVAGRSDLVLKLEIITKIIGTIMLLITLPISIKAMCIGTIISVTLCLVVNTYYTSRYVDVTQWEQILDLIKPFLMCVVMGGVVVGAVFLIENNILKLVVGVPLGILVYFGTAIINKTPEYKMCLELINNRNK
jgi:O-antigen/teichoic acid export membrane protein